LITHYFAYGSNMNPLRVATRGLRVSGCRGAQLGNLHLVFDKVGRDHPTCAHANVVYRRGGCVEGVLYQLVEGAEILKMDPFERAPINYSRGVVHVETSDGSVAAWTYFANPGVRRQGLLPERAYLNHLLAGRPYLSESYFQWLQRTRCADES
jgi:hypothetical protein